MSLALTPEIAASLLAGILPMFVLLVWARLAGTTAHPAIRFRRAWLFSIAAWGVATLSLATFDLISWQDLVAGLLIVIGAIIASFILWSLLAWGFTATLLKVAVAAESPFSPEAWVAHYTGCSDINHFTRNRLRVLYVLGLAAEKDGCVGITGLRARVIGEIARGARFLFGL